MVANYPDVETDGDYLKAEPNGSEATFVFSAFTSAAVRDEALTQATILLGRDQVAALVGQLQSWLARTAAGAAGG